MPSVSQVARGAKHWGELATIRGQVKYSISPMEMKATAGMLSKGLPNTLWRLRTTAVYVVPPFLAAYLFFDYVEKLNARMERKTPGEFDHET